MACGATLKRPRELDPLMNNDTTIKRRRTTVNSGHCNPFLQSPNRRSPTHVGDGNSVDSEMPSSFETSAGHGQPTQEGDSLDARLQAEVRLIRRRRALFGGGGNESNSSSDSESEQRMDGGFGHGMQQGRQQTSPRASGGDRPIFTYAQVRAICERLLKEQEVRLREEYDQTLNSRLAEQHDTFVRFTYDQIHRRLGDTPMSYLS